jgi:tol-pal system protein YbgF
VKLNVTCIVVFTVFVLSSANVSAANAEIVQRLDRIERLLQSQGLLDMLQQIESLQQEMSAIRGDIEFQNHTLEQLKKRQRNLYTDTDQRLQALERKGIDTSSLISDINFIETESDGTPPLQTLKPVDAGISASSATAIAENIPTFEVIENTSAAPTLKEAPEAQNVMTEPVTTSKEDLALAAIDTSTQLDPIQIRAQYQQALKLLKATQYQQAIKAFREFLMSSPDSEYSDNAQYWLGEAFYVSRNFEQALLEYNNLLSNYPDSRKLSHSLLKIGFCYYEMGQISEASIRLEKLKQEHPGTTAARLADERLKKIAQEGLRESTEESQ